MTGHSLPAANWSFASLSELLVKPTINIVDGPFGSNLKASEYRDYGVPILRIQNVKRFNYVLKNIKFITESKARQLTRHAFAAGDIVITKLGAPLGEACILPDDIQSGVIVADLVRLRLDNPYIDKWWLMYAINSPDVAQQLKKATKGTTRPRVNLGHIRNLKLWLPPYKEQRRIVAKIEELFSELDKGIEALTTARKQLKAYRQSVLKHAFDGRLTMDLRSTQPAWRDTCMGKEIEFLTSGSRGWAEYYADSGDTFIRAQNLKHDRLDLTDIAFVKLPEGNTEGLRTRVNVGDVLITITGANVTKTGVVNFDWGTAYVSQHVALCRPRPTIRPMFLYWYLVSEAHGRRQLNDAAYGAGKPGLNLDNIRSVTLSLPSAQEQTVVLERIEAALSVEQELTETIDHELQRTSAIRQSILKKAFSGQLVALCLNDEPASVLLERIRAERESAPVKSSRNGRNGHAKNGSKNAQKNRKKQLA